MAYCPVASLTDAFQHSGDLVELVVSRCWPLASEAAGQRRMMRMEAREHRTGDGSGAAAAAATAAAAAATAAAALPATTPIDITLFDSWASVPIAVQDVLSIRRCVVERGRPDSDHPWELRLDDSAECASASLRVRGWKERLLKREGKEYTVASLAKAQEEAEEAALAEAEQKAAEMAAKKQAAAAAKGTPAAKKPRVTESAAAFQSAAALIAAGQTAAAPILLDDESAAAGAAAPAAAASATAAASKKRKKCGSEIHGAYTYTPLSEALARPGKLNFYGVVIQSRPPKTTARDMMSSLVVSDMSLPLNDSITFNIFRADASELPPPRVARGDIVRIHRATVALHGDKPTGVLNRLGSSFILIKGGEGESMEPYFNPKATYSEVHEDVVSELRAWAHKNLAFRIQAPPQDKYRRTFSQFDPSTTFCDLYCRLVYTDPHGTLMQQLHSSNQAVAAAAAAASVAPADRAGLPLAYIWDGTDWPRTMGLQRAMLPNGLTLPAPAAAAPRADQSSLPFSSSRPVIVTPAYGSILPIVLANPSVLDLLLPPRGRLAPRFVKLQNVSLSRARDGLFYLQYHGKSSAQVLEEMDANVQHMMSAYAARESREASLQQLRPWRTLTVPCLAVPPNPALPLTPIKWLLSSECATEVVDKYRIRGRVISCAPHPSQGQSYEGAAAAAAAAAAVVSAEGEMEESKEGEAAPGAAVTADGLPMASICKAFCHTCDTWSSCSPHTSQPDRCHLCTRTDGLSYGYFLQLLIHDSTGALPVLLCGKEADGFFHGLPADNLSSNTATLKFVRQRLHKLMQPGAFIDCHVHAYNVPQQDEAAAVGGAGADGMGGVGSGSQEFLSQDLAAFFAPMPDVHEVADEEEGEGQAPASQVKMRRVFRVADCTFKLL